MDRRIPCQYDTLCSFLLRLLTRELTHDTGREHFPELKQVLVAGEILYARDIDTWQKAVGKHVELVNLYGASETTLIKTFHRIKEVPANGAQAIHAGQPIADTIAIIINTANKLCRIGEIGEIYIKTPYTTKGYFGDETQTKKYLFRTR